MENDFAGIAAQRFKMLKSKTDEIFDSNALKDKSEKEDYFARRFNPFYDSLEKEIKSLPAGPYINDEIDSWVGILKYRIDRATVKGKLTETGRIFKQYRKKLRTRLLEIQTDLIKIEPAVHSAAPKKQEAPLSFADIFIPHDWRKYIDALHKVESPVLSPDYKFIGKRQKHKGVVCSWIKELQLKGVIHEKYTRQQLAAVLNSEIKNLSLGKDGKTLDNISSVYADNYQYSLSKLTNLLP